jgi:hypothetical protein
MNSEASLPPILHAAESPSVAAPPRGVLATAWKTLVFFWKYFLGALFCQSIAGAIAIVGWTHRLAQRSALHYWWARSDCKQPGTRLRDHLARHDPSHEHLHWPNWFGAQNFRAAIRRDANTSTLARIWQVIKAPFRSLGTNVKIGLQGIFNTWVLTMPACILWLFSWYDGWNNSFNKGYEQAVVGPAVGVLGIILFIAAMMYVPLGQARHAVTGDWRSFYNFSFVWGLVRRHWLACLVLAGFTSLFFLPLVIMKTAPQFFGTDAKFASMNDKQVIQMLNGYFFACAFLVFPLFVALRLLAARIYARGILLGVQTGEISVHDLAPKERLELQRLNLIQVNPPRSRHVLLRVARSTTSLALFGAGIFATAFLWFTFVAQIYTSEFFSYHGALGWLNQPLIQLPWFRYIPAHAQNPAGEFFLTALILAFAFGIPALIQRVRRLLHH